LVAFLIWLLTLPPVVVILLVSVLISALTVVVYKYTTNQSRLKSIQEEQKALRDEMKKSQNNPDKLMKLQKRAMELSMEIMPESMKSNIFTFLPVILIFGWLSANMSYLPITPNSTFTTTVNFEKLVPERITLKTTEGLELITAATQDSVGMSVSWQLKGIEGTHNLTYYYGKENYTLKVLVTPERKYLTPTLGKQRKLFFIGPVVGEGIPDWSNLKSISIDLKKIRPFGTLPLLGGLDWFWTYLIFSLIFTSVMRKYLKVF
jgi:uncharacterized membrane protein (DUF106 family)